MDGIFAVDWICITESGKAYDLDGRKVSSCDCKLGCAINGSCVDPAGNYEEWCSTFSMDKGCPELVEESWISTLISTSNFFIVLIICLVIFCCYCGSKEDFYGTKRHSQPKEVKESAKDNDVDDAFKRQQ